MNLKKVDLRNWRSYRNATFRFPSPEEGRNVILVGAQNGTGKTSFLIALYLGLFGRDAIHLIEGIRLSGIDSDKTGHYKHVLQRMLHRDALNDQSPYMQVVLTFEDDSSTVTVRRKWYYSKGGYLRDVDSRDAEEVLIEEDGSPIIYRSWQEANDRIAELLFPKNVMPCFFFDGEQAQARVEAAGGKTLLDAVNSLYGTGLLDELTDSLHTFINNEKRRLQREVGSVADDDLEQRYEALEQHREAQKELSRQLEEALKGVSQLEEERERYTAEMYEILGDTTSDVEEYHRTVRALEEQELSLRQAMSAGLAKLALPLALSRRKLRVRRVLESEIIRDDWLSLRENAASKAEEIVESVLPRSGDVSVHPPLNGEQKEQLREQFFHALGRLGDPPPVGCASGYTFRFLSESDRKSLLQKMERAIQEPAPDVVKAVNDWQETKTRLQHARRQLETFDENRSKLKELKENLDAKGKEISDRQSEIGRLRASYNTKGQEINELKATIGQMEKKREVSNPLQQKIDVARRVTRAVDDAVEGLAPMCRHRLEERCAVHFSEMTSRQYSGFSVKVDEHPRLVGPKQEVVYVSSLSGAEKRAFGLAFTLAVADVSGESAPIVIDTPVGNMDSEYRSRVLRYVSDAANGQVIFLSHDEEITVQYAYALEPYVASQMLVCLEDVRDGRGVARVYEGQYFGT